MKNWTLIAGAVLMLAGGAAQAQEALTPKSLKAALAAKPTGAAAEQLAERVRGYFGRMNITKGRCRRRTR